MLHLSLISSFPILLLFVASLFSGFTNVIGGGGSALTLPLLLILGLDSAEANGTNRIAILSQTLVALKVYENKGGIRKGLLWHESLWVLPGAILGALIALQLDTFWFKKILALVLGWILLEPFISKRGTTASPKLSPCFFKLGLLGVGFYGGFIQAGVGFLILWLLRSFLNQNLIQLNQHKLFLVLILNVPAFFVFLGTGHMNWELGLVMSLGNVLGAWSAVHWSFKKGELWTRRILNGILIVFSFLLLFEPR